MLKALISLLVLISAFFAWQKFDLEKLVAPCTEPIAYVVGTFDRRFGLKQKDFLSALTLAEAVWETDLGRELFAYDPETGDLKVNLIYDYRQAVTEELTEIEGGVKEDEAAYRNLEAKYFAVKREHLALKLAYDSRVNLFNAQNEAYQFSVEEWNNGDRTSQGQFKALEAERLALEAEIREVKVLENDLNEKVKELNTLVDRLNRLGRALNLNVEEYNTVGASRGETFAGGIYTSGPEGEKIDIFEFKNYDKLVRVLAHELGHALGLEHVDDPEAIMYKLNEGEAEKLTETDLNALKALCKIN